MISWELVFAIIPGIILFLFGIEQFSKEVQLAAGEYFRNIIQRLTITPLRGTLAGSLVTAVIQSSMATTVITVGLVNAGIISFAASLGIIFGANLGTTLTSQLIALNLTSFAPVFILVGFVISISGGRYKVIGRPVFYFGLVFFSLSLISGVMLPYQNDPQLIEFVNLMDNVFLQIMFGMIITIIFQSSSVTTGLVVVMAQNGLITPSMAIPIMMGANLGTPSTTLLVAYRMNTSAKRAAVAHFLFNFLGVIIFLPLLGPFTNIIENLGGDPGQQVANAHLIFNLTCCIIFLILIRPFERLVIRVVPGREDDVVFITKYLPRPLLKSNSENFKMIEKEIVHLLNQSDKLLQEINPLLDDPGYHSPRISQLKEYANYLDTQIGDTALELSYRELTSKEISYLAGLERISKLGEVLANQTWELADKIHQIQEKNIKLAAESKQAIIDSIDPCNLNLKALLESFPVITDEINESMRKRDELLREIITFQYRQYLRRYVFHKTPAGSAFSRALFQIEGMAGTIREIRKSIRLLAKEEARLPVQSADAPISNNAKE